MIMNISELQEPYKTLAEFFIEQEGVTSDELQAFGKCNCTRVDYPTNSLIRSNFRFWDAVEEGKSPEIPTHIINYYEENSDKKLPVVIDIPKPETKSKSWTMTFRTLSQEQKDIIAEMAEESDGQSNFKRGFYWQIDEQYATDEFSSRLFMTPKDFYDKEECLADFSYGAEDLLDESDLLISEMETNAASSYSFKCDAETMAAILKKYEPFFEERVILND
jgi:hypothetical protein